MLLHLSQRLLLHPSQGSGHSVVVRDNLHTFSLRRQLTQMKAKLARERSESQGLQEELRKAKGHEQMALARLEKVLCGPL